MYRHADTHKLALVRCCGVRRMHLNSNMSACEQASVSQFGSSAHGSLLRAKFQSCEETESNRRFEFGGDNMLIRIGDFEFTEVWDGVFYKKLSNYPQITDWEIRTIIEFIEYEKRYGRECVIECEDSNVLKLVNEGIAHKEMFLSTPRPKLLTECTACLYRKGCVTDYVCHTTSAENAIKKKFPRSELQGSRCAAHERFFLCIRNHLQHHAAKP